MKSAIGNAPSVTRPSCSTKQKQDSNPKAQNGLNGEKYGRNDNGRRTVETSESEAIFKTHAKQVRRGSTDELEKRPGRDKVAAGILTRQAKAKMSKHPHKRAGTPLRGHTSTCSGLTLKIVRSRTKRLILRQKWITQGRRAATQAERSRCAN
eukprot:6190204-Pleurochrysis_carterae.AAC.2